jgi:hypothetical protein
VLIWVTINVRSAPVMSSRSLPAPLEWPAWEARLDGGAWVEVEVGPEHGGRYRVHPIGLTSEYDTEVDRGDLRPKSSWSKGDEVTIDWEQSSYPGRVLEVDGPWVSVHWYGYDETLQGGWIRADRLHAQGA